MNKDKIKNKQKDLLKKGNKTFNEFKSFISQKNVIDLAIGVIIGNSFGKIVSSLVDNVFMPLIGLLIGGIDFKYLSVTVNKVEVNYGIFIQNVVDFLIIAACIFTVLKFIQKFNKKKEEQEEVKVDETVALLTEIRDLLKNKK